MVARTARWQRPDAHRLSQAAHYHRLQRCSSWLGRLFAESPPVRSQVLLLNPRQVDKGNVQRNKKPQTRYFNKDFPCNQKGKHNNCLNRIAREIFLSNTTLGQRTVSHEPLGFFWDSPKRRAGNTQQTQLPWLKRFDVRLEADTCSIRADASSSSFLLLDRN